MTTQPNTNPATKTANDDEIDLLALAKTFWNGKKTILISVLAAGVLGVLVALLSPIEYAAKTTMVPQMAQSGNKLGGLSSLAAMAGVNIDMASGSETLSPMVYPQIVQSAPYQIELMNTPFNFSEVSEPISLFEYYTNIVKPGMLSLVGKYTIGLPGVIISALKGKEKEKTVAELHGPISLTKKQEEVRKLIGEKVTLDVDAKQGYLTLQASFPEALLSAQVAEIGRAHV